jgi:hypothetical protein
MRALVPLALLASLAGCAASGAASSASDGWISLFDGKSLDGWTASENQGTFTVQNGMIVAHGPRSHLFYTGPVHDHDFTNFEWKADVMTMPHSNSGMYIHTEYQPEGWPAKGYEVQVNNSYPDPRKTGSLYAVQDVMESPVRDSVWFTQDVTVQGKRIVIKVNGKTTVDYTEPADVQRPADMSGRVLSHGTVALQGHDPGSTVYFKNIMIRPLPE